MYVYICNPYFLGLWFVVHETLIVFSICACSLGIWFKYLYISETNIAHDLYVCEFILYKTLVCSYMCKFINPSF